MESEDTKVVDGSAPWFVRTKALVVASVKEFGADKAGRMAAALAYYTLFSLVPLLFVAVAISTMTLGSGTAELPDNCEDVVEQDLGTEPLDRAVGEVESVAGAAVSDPVRVILCGARKSAGPTLSIGLLLAVFSASGIFLHAQGVLNHIFQAPEHKVTGIMGIVRQRSIAFVSALVLAILVLVPVVAVGLVQFARTLLPSTLDWLAPVLSLAVPLVSLGLLIVIVAVTFQALTAVTIPAKAARRGGAITAIVGLVAAFLVGAYLGRGAGTGALGVLGGLAVLLLFFYLMWTVYLLGAEVTKTYSDYLEHGDIVQPSVRKAQARRAAPVSPSTGPALATDTEQPTKVGFGSAVALLVGIVIGRLGDKSNKD